jgi:hypothetical protein
VPLAADLTIEVRLPERYDRLSLHAPGGDMTGDLEREADVQRLRLRDVPLYGIAVLDVASR